jgi:hypothetical protein
VFYPVERRPHNWGDRRELNPPARGGAVLVALSADKVGSFLRYWPRSTFCRLSHSVTVTLGARSTSRTCFACLEQSLAFQTRALTATAFLAKLVEEEGIEPSFAGCGPAVLPLNDSPHKTGKSN